MRLPASLAPDAERIAFDGMSGWTHGRFAVGDYAGGYERSEERLAFFETFVTNYGHSEFTIAGPAISSTIEARCRMRERVLDLGIAEFTPKPMSYRCEFTADEYPIAARFELQEVRNGIGGMLSKNERRGEMLIDGERIEIRSVHKLEGSSFVMANPIGYVFEQDGRPVGAVELNGTPALFLPRGTDPERARALTVAATALAVFWDPANSALEP